MYVEITRNEQKKYTRRKQKIIKRHKRRKCNMKQMYKKTEMERKLNKIVIITVVLTDVKKKKKIRRNEMVHFHKTCISFSSIIYKHDDDNYLTYKSSSIQLIQRNGRT